jgi:hypothetical protein
MKLIIHIKNTLSSKLMPWLLHDFIEMLHILYSLVELGTVYFEVTEERFLNLLNVFELFVLSLK